MKKLLLLLLLLPFVSLGQLRIDPLLNYDSKTRTSDNPIQVDTLPSIAPLGQLVSLVSDTTQLYRWNGVSWVAFGKSGGGGTDTTAWHITGNSGTITGNFIGTTDNMPLNFKVNNQKAGLIDTATADNIFFGINAGLLSSGQYNIGIGSNALYSNASGQGNIAVGNATLTINTSNYNTAIGNASMANNISGNGNTAIGNMSMINNISGTGNFAGGISSLINNQTGSFNTAMGGESLSSNDSSDNNTGVGYYALKTNRRGHDNLGLGMFADVFYDSINYTISLGSWSVAKKTYQFAVSDSIKYLYLPLTNHTNGNVLTTDSFGNASWQTSSGGLTIGDTVKGNITGNTLLMNDGTYHLQETNSSLGKITYISGELVATGTDTTTSRTSLQVGNNISGAKSNTGVAITVQNDTALTGYATGLSITATGMTVGNITGVNIDVTGGANALHISHGNITSDSGSVTISNGIVILKDSNATTKTEYNQDDNAIVETVSGVASKIQRYQDTTTVSINCISNGDTSNLAISPTSFSWTIGSTYGKYTALSSNSDFSVFQAFNVTQDTGNMLFPKDPITGVFAPGFAIVRPSGSYLLHFPIDTPTVNDVMYVKTLSGNIGGYNIYEAGWESVAAAANTWSLTGNSGTVAGTNFIGTTDNKPFNIRVNNLPSGHISSILGDSDNTSFGLRSLMSITSGIWNTAFGDSALVANSSGYGNTAFGVAALSTVRTANRNTAVGYSSLSSIYDDFNTAVGYDALRNLNSGQYNIGVGHNPADGLATGSGNVFVGWSQVPSTTCDNITAIGNGIILDSAGLTNAAGIGYGVHLALSNSVILGKNVNVGIGTSVPVAKLQVVGGEARFDSIALKSGANTKIGSGTFVLGIDTVFTNATPANGNIHFQNTGGTITNLGLHYEDASLRVPGVYFIMKSVNLLDASNFSWDIIDSY